MDEIFEVLEELKNYLFNEWTQNHVNVGCDYKLEAELEKQIKNLNAIKSALQRLAAIEKGKNTDIIDNYMAFKNIEEADPSEALEKLKTFNYIMTRCKEEDSYIIKFPLGIQKGTTFGEEMEKSYEVIHQALLNKSKKEQGFDIFMQILTSDVEDKKIMPYALFKATEEQFGKDSKEANLMEDLLKRWQNEKRT